MKLPLPSFGTKKQPPDYYLALLLRDDHIKSIIFEELEGKIKVVSSHAENFTTSLEEADVKEWLEVFDKAIGTAENALPENINVQKTIFGTKESWIEDNKIKKEYLAKLKKVSQELDLQPIGFLVFTEAIAHLLNEEEGTPLSAILVEVGKNNLSISIFRAGKIVASSYKPITESITHTTEKMLLGIENIEVLPSKMVIVNHAETTKITSEFTKYEWKKTLPFLHPPQISILPQDIDIKAVLLGTAAQLGLEINSTEIKKAETDILEENILTADSATAIEEEPTKQEKTLKTHIPVLTADNFGFVTDADIATINATRSDEKQEETLDQEEKSKPQEEEHKETKEEKTALRMLFEKVIPIKTLAGLKNRKKKERIEMDEEEPAPTLATESIKHRHITPKISKKLLFGIPAILIIIIAGIVVYILNVKATVTLTLTPKTISKTEQITFSSQQDNNFAQNIIHGDAMTTSVQTQTSTQATGTKNIGNKAKGIVTIFNNNIDPKTIPAGTVLTSSNNLKFTLDKDVNVASQSGDQFSGTKPGTTDGTITASDIGTEYNLPSNTAFSLGTTGTVVAKNSSAFSGGTKQQITIVTQADLDKVKTDTINNSQDKAKQQLAQSSTSSKGIIPAITTVKMDNNKTSYDHKVGDQTSTVTLKSTINYTSIAYDKTQLVEYGKSIVQGSIQSDQTLASNGITTDITDTKVQNDHQLQATIMIQASLLPILDTGKLIQQIAGKSTQQAENFLSGQPQIGNITIHLSPNIPFAPKILPGFTNHITITTSNK